MKTSPTAAEGVETPEIAPDLLRTLIEAARKMSPWRDAAGIAEHLGVSPKTVQNLSGPSVADPIPFHRLTPNGEKRFHVPTVDAWLLRRRDAA